MAGGLSETIATVHPTQWLWPELLSRRLGRPIRLANEAFQYTGSFKFRAAFHLANNISQSHLLTASSGNFGQALAYSCAQLGKHCHVVMPDTSSKTKIRNVREYGGTVDLIDTRKTSRSERLEQLKRQFPEAYVASPYDDPLVIEGNATLGLELASSAEELGAIVVPIGGGGLASGIVEGLRRAGRAASVIGAEPLLANDAARSLKAGQRLSNEREPATIADGARTVSLGERNWEILCRSLTTIVEVPEETIVEATRMLYELANLKVEPTGALAVAAVLAQPELFGHGPVCCIVSGGNVDAATYCRILAGSSS